MTTTDTHRNRIETRTMRNFYTLLIDRRFKPSSRNGGSKHLWVNLFGRDWVVKRSKPTLLGIVGTFITTLGAGGLAWGSLVNFDPQRLGIALLIVGVTLICYKKLETKNLAADEIYNVGRERGESDGYDEGYRDGLEEGQKTREMKVVPLSPRCTDCPNCARYLAVGSVADRG
jgi:hypothetical protein